MPGPRRRAGRAQAKTAEDRPPGQPDSAPEQGVSPRRCQGNVKAPSRGPESIVILGAPHRTERTTWLRTRILELIRAGVPCNSWDPVRCAWTFQGLWLIPPGACPWWKLRQRVGGRVDSATFRAAVDDLLANGRLLELWLAMPDRRAPAHVILLPGCSRALRHPVAQARGRPDVIAREPWAATLRRP